MLKIKFFLLIFVLVAINAKYGIISGLRYSDWVLYKKKYSIL